MRKILIAVDETEASRRAAAFVEQFFQGDDISLTAVNVARAPVDWVPATPYGVVSAWPYAPDGDRSPVDESFAEAESTAEGVAARQVPPGTNIEVAFGETVDAISAAAENVDADLIVVGAGEKGFMDRLLHGSVSERLVRRAPRPVLVVG